MKRPNQHSDSDSDSDDDFGPRPSTGAKEDSGPDVTRSGRDEGEVAAAPVAAGDHSNRAKDRVLKKVRKDAFEQVVEECIA
jgi:hypothetical protein